MHLIEEDNNFVYDVSERVMNTFVRRITLKHMKFGYNNTERLETFLNSVSDKNMNSKCTDKILNKDLTNKLQSEEEFGRLH